MTHKKFYETGYFHEKSAFPLPLFAVPALMLAACGQLADDRTPEELFYALPVSSGITETLEDSALYDLFASGQPLRMNVDFSLDKFTIPMQADLSGTAFSFSMDCNSKADLRGNLTVDMPDEKVACDLLMTGENAYVFSDTLGEKWLPDPDFLFVRADGY